MKLRETDIEFVRRAMNEIAAECDTGKDHNFVVAIRKLADAHEADRKKLDTLEDKLVNLERDFAETRASLRKLRQERQ